MSANRALKGLHVGCNFKNWTTDFFYLVKLKTNDSSRHNREILSNKYYISRLFFAELALSVSPPTLGEVSREAIQSKI